MPCTVAHMHLAIRTSRISRTVRVCITTTGTTKTNRFNSTYGGDASVLVQMSTESGQTTCVHCYKFQAPAGIMYLQADLTSVAAFSIDDQLGRPSSELIT